jgi:hypothetical protein
MVADGKTPDASVALNRSLFVTARLDESRYPEPVLKALPTTIAELDAIEASVKASEVPEATDVLQMNDVDFAPVKPTETLPETPDATPKPEATTPTDAIKSDATNMPKVEAPSTETPKIETPIESPATPAPAEKPATGDQSNFNVTLPKGRFVALQEEAAKATAIADEAKEAVKQATAEPAVATPDVPAPATEVSSEAKPEMKAEPTAEPVAAPTPPAAETEQEAKERLEAAREKINKENQRLIDERKDKIEAGKKKAAELNARFAEWYYEISDADYKRMRIKLDELIEKKGNPSSPPANAGGAPDFGGGLPFGFPGN